MVIEREPLGAGADGVVYRPLRRAVTPSDLLCILLDGVLRVVDDQVCPSKELHMAPVLGVYSGRTDARQGRARVLPQRRRVGLMVGRVDHRDAAGFQAI